MRVLLPHSGRALAGKLSGPAVHQAAGQCPRSVRRAGAVQVGHRPPACFGALRQHLVWIQIHSLCSGISLRSAMDRTLLAALMQAQLRTPSQLAGGPQPHQVGAEQPRQTACHAGEAYGVPGKPMRLQGCRSSTGDCRTCKGSSCVWRCSRTPACLSRRGPTL